MSEPLPMPTERQQLARDIRAVADHFAQCIECDQEHELVVTADGHHYMRDGHDYIPRCYVALGVPANLAQKMRVYADDMEAS